MATVSQPPPPLAISTHAAVGGLLIPLQELLQMSGVSYPCTMTLIQSWLFLPVWGAPFALRSLRVLIATSKGERPGGGGGGGGVEAKSTNSNRRFQQAQRVLTNAAGMKCSRRHGMQPALPSLC